MHVYGQFVEAGIITQAKRVTGCYIFVAPVGISGLCHVNPACAMHVAAMKRSVIEDANNMRFRILTIAPEYAALLPGYS